MFNTNRTRSYYIVEQLDEEYTRFGTIEVTESGEYEFYSSTNVRLFITPPLEDNEPVQNDVALGMCCIAMMLLLIAPVVLVIGIVVWIMEHKKKPAAKKAHHPYGYPSSKMPGAKKAYAPPRYPTAKEPEPTNAKAPSDSRVSKKSEKAQQPAPPAKPAPWELFASDVDGQYTEDGILRMPMVTVRFQDWSIYMDTLSQERLFHTRIRALYPNRTGFKWSIHREGVLMNIKDTLSLEKEPRVYKKFHPEFVIRSNDKKKASLLFSNPRMKKLLLSQPDVFFASERPDFLYIQPLPPDSKELFFVSPGMIEDSKRLKELFDLFKETLATMDMLDL